MWSSLTRAAQLFSALLFGDGTLLLLLGAGVWLSFCCGFPQLRRFPLILRQTLGTLLQPQAGQDSPGLSSFQAMCTALGGTVGTGNVAGVAGAILLGGPGAVFWMWVSALFGMCTKFAEISLALRYRTRGADGRPCGGPMITIERGLGRAWRPLAACFALGGGLASFGIGNLVQSRQIALSLGALAQAPPSLSALLLAAFVGAVLLGGVGRVGRIAALLVPLMALLYLSMGLCVLSLHLGELPALLALIVRSAFDPAAAGGAFAGLTLRRTLRQGLARGLFSNEAGLGSAPMAHAAASCGEPCAQGLWGALEVFLDSFVICTVTALTVLLAGSGALSGSAEDAAFTAFETLLPGGGGRTLLSVCLLFFALSSIVSWSYYGELCWRWLFRGSERATRLYRICFVLCCLPGALVSGERLWAVSDALNGLMALPNLLSLLLLSDPVRRMSRDFFSRQEAEKRKKQL